MVLCHVPCLKQQWLHAKFFSLHGILLTVAAVLLLLCALPAVQPACAVLQIVSGSRDKTIRLWNTLGECKYTIGEPEGHTGECWVLARPRDMAEGVKAGQELQGGCLQDLPILKGAVPAGGVDEWERVW